MHLTSLAIGRHHVAAPRPLVPGTSVVLREGAVGFEGVWDRVQLPYERVALCTAYGTFLSCQLDEQGYLVLTLAADLGPGEAFEEVLWPDGGVSLRTCELSFVAAPHLAHGPVRADGEDGEPATRFRYGAVRSHVEADVLAVKAGAPRVADMPRQFARPPVESRE